MGSNPTRLGNRSVAQSGRATSWSLIATSPFIFKTWKHRAVVQTRVTYLSTVEVVGSNPTSPSGL